MRKSLRLGFVLDLVRANLRKDSSNILKLGNSRLGLRGHIKFFDGVLRDVIGNAIKQETLEGGRG